jgi:hypothetical protein
LSASGACNCGACAACTSAVLPAVVGDPLTFRHGAIKSRLLSRIAATEIDGSRPLVGLGTRDVDDPAIALIDALAGAFHVLAWNIARLSNDGSIRHTEDRDALVDLTRLLGYEPRPALAATTTLTFTLDTADGAPKSATIPKGTKIASVPLQDEKPQTFESDAILEARVEWNALLPVQQQADPVIAAATTSSITIKGVSTPAKVGDLVLACIHPPAPSTWLLGRVALVTRQPELTPPRTVIQLAATVGVTTISAMQGPSFKNQVVILGVRAAAFGATAPDLSLMSDEVREGQRPSSDLETDPLPTEWLNLKMVPGGNTSGGAVDLDAVYADAMSNRFVLFHAGTARELGRIDASLDLARTGFGLSAKVTRIDVTGINLAESTGFGAKVRETTIYLETAREMLLVEDADVLLPTPSDRITVQGTLTLPVGRRLVLYGEPAATGTVPGTRIGEVAVLKSSTTSGGTTELVFEKAVTTTFRSRALSILANAVSASHGETPATPPGGAELIGSGTASTSSPRFPLKRSPLAFVPSENLRGYAPAIEVRVNERLYAEVPTLFGLGSEDRAFAVQTTREGTSSVQFAGRLPSGTHNISAVYRTGGGLAGNLAAGRITTALTPVLGVKTVTNPVPADGASDAETLEDMRTAAPQSIRTLDRVVSLADFEAFTRTYRGIGKALATELHDGMRSVVCLTIATTSLAQPGTDLIDALRRTLAQVCVPGRSIRIEGFTDLTAQVTVALAVDPAFRRSDVEAAVRTELDTTFSRSARRFGEALHRSAVIAAVQGVDGVIAARLAVFQATGIVDIDGRLLCPVPGFDTNHIFIKAGLLAIDAAAVSFVEMLP